MRKDTCYTITFDAAAEAALQEAVRLTDGKAVPDIIRTALACFIDLLDAEQRNLAIVFRDAVKGKEWRYSPRKPGQAVALSRTGAKRTLAPAAAAPVRVGASSRARPEDGGPATDNVVALPAQPRR
jgi:hypothetical protein